MTDIDAAMALNKVEVALFEKNPDLLASDEVFDMTPEEAMALEEKQNSAIIGAFKKSAYVRRH